jgi:hypothetical protein
MELRTYTGLWKVERRLYKFYDINLPYPVSIKQIGTFLFSVVPWFAIMGFIGVPFAPPFGHLIWLFPPALFTWYANRPVAEGKTLTEFGFSQIRYFLSHKKYAGLSKTFKTIKSRNVTGKVWVAEWAAK